MTTKTDKATLDTVDHVAVVVTDIEKAVVWYTTTFACDILYQDDTWAYLRFANVNLALVLPSQHPAHVAIEVADAAQFGQVRTHRDGVRYVYTKDPFGNATEVVDRK